MRNYLGQNGTRHNACGSTSTFHVQDVPIGGYTLIKSQSTHRPAEVQHYLDQALDRFLQHSSVGHVFWREWLEQDGQNCCMRPSRCGWISSLVCCPYCPDIVPRLEMNEWMMASACCCIWQLSVQGKLTINCNSGSMTGRTCGKAITESSSVVGIAPFIGCRQ